MPGCVDSNKLTLEKPKSGREYEVAFISQKVAERLKQHIMEKHGPDDRIFPKSDSESHGSGVC
jgi:hypothetical protein